MDDPKTTPLLTPVVHRGEKSPLFEALAKAQQFAKDVPATATNSQFGYRYPPCESVIRAGKDALAAFGLSLTPLSQLCIHPSESGIGPILRCLFLLGHKDGESIVITREMGIVIDKRKGPEKAIAAADTLCLSYTLRTLLLICRPGVDEDVSAQQEDDREQKKVYNKASNHQTEKKKEERERSLPATGHELLTRITALEVDLCTEGVCKKDELITFVRDLIEGQGFTRNIEDLAPLHFREVSSQVALWVRDRRKLARPLTRPAPVAS